MPSMIFLLLGVVALLSSASANMVKFCNADNQAREICWYPEAGLPAVHTGVVPAGQCLEEWNLESGHGYMFHPVNEGQGDRCPLKAVVGEVTFHDIHTNLMYYDISAVDNLYDNSGIHTIMPLDGGDVCHCDRFPCVDQCVYLGSGGKENKSSPQDQLLVIMYAN